MLLSVFSLTDNIFLSKEVNPLPKNANSPPNNNNNNNNNSFYFDTAIYTYRSVALYITLPINERRS